jgi:hypothetical protein
VFQLRAEMVPREPECIIGLLSCKSGLKHCRAHLAKSEVLGSILRPKQSLSCLSFKAEVL